VGVAGSLLSETLRDDFVRDVNTQYEGLRDEHRNREPSDRAISLAQARANRLVVDWAANPAPKPTFLGARTLDQYPLAELVERIDWTPFFQTWELTGHYPAILTDPVVGKTATNLFNDAQKMLGRIVRDRLFTAKARFGFFPAASTGDDIQLYAVDGSRAPLAVVHSLRQQSRKSGDRANLALADFVAPVESGQEDYIGLFAVTAGHGVDALVAEYEAKHDDYNAILAKALADRLAEAFAERLHERVRQEFWGYAPGEKLDNDGLIHEKYQGVRPAPGYPACPDHTEKGLLFQLLDAERTVGIQLTESFAMLPTAAVSGYYFWRPESQYFGVGKLGKDQVEDYAERKGVSVKEAERWLAPNLGYDR
jgi:5-methyltetrahydrofolate--homocysteine methyltransferase